MSRLLNLPTLDPDAFNPNGMEFDVVGSDVSGGRNGAGGSLSMETSGGGSVVGTYAECFIHAAEQHEMLNALAARLNGGFRYINVPIITDFMGPFPIVGDRPRSIVSGITHSDGALFSDDAGYSLTTVHGEVRQNAALNAGIIRMQVYGEHRPLRHSDWFSIYHPTRGWRAYRYWEVRSRTAATNPTYELAISPPLREAVTTGTRVEFARPRFVAKFPAGFTLPWRVTAPWFSNPTIQFVEAMR